MKLEIRVGVDFGKLANEMPKILENHTSRIAVSSAERAKNAIDSGKFAPLKDSTREIREKGQSPASDRTATNSFKPLVHTGRLRDSIKPTKDGLSMKGYGAVHLEDGKTANSSFARRFNMVGTRRVARNFLDQAIILGDKDTTKLTKTLIKKMRNALNLKSPLVLKT